MSLLVLALLAAALTACQTTGTDGLTFLGKHLAGFEAADGTRRSGCRLGLIVKCGPVACCGRRSACLARAGSPPASGRRLWRPTMEEDIPVGVVEIINSLCEGVYVCNLERRITYWSDSAERITGWSAEDVVGRQCFDNVLCHVDKDGHQLCGEEYCPLHRAMVTGHGTSASLLVFARGKSGDRIPLEVSVAPVLDSTGQVIGGVETFRDASGTIKDLERAKAIQQRAQRHALPADPRLRVATHYIPHDIIGGDFYAIRALDDDRYGFMLADVMGHGIAAALYTMHLSQLWDRFSDTLSDPAVFAAALNDELTDALQADLSFATALCGVLDLAENAFRFTSAGGPPLLHTRADGTHEFLEQPGFPLGLVEDATFEGFFVEVGPGDNLLLFSDGVVEIANADDELLGTEGLLTLLRSLGYPEVPIRMDLVELELLRFSNDIRFPDDLTLVEIRIDG
jgi:PAS domain S-box-containing protein